MSCCKTYDPCLDGKLNQIGSYAAAARSSAQSSANSAASAQSNATLIQNIYNDFSEKYLGSFDSPPTPPIEEGALYYNTVSNGLFVWNGTAWISADFNEFTNFTATGTTTARNLVTRTAEVFNVKDFGAVGDGVANDRNAFQSAFNAANAAGGGVVYIPPGRYRKADGANSVWTMYSNTSLVGEGDQSVIFFDDRPTTPDSADKRLLTVQNNSVNIEFKNFKVEGTLLTYLTETGGKIGINGSNIDNLRMQNVTMIGIRSIAAIFDRIKNSIFTGNNFQYIARDGLDFWDSWNVTCSNNVFRAVCDSAISAHSMNYSLPVPSGIVITNNVFEAGQGIDVLGAKQVTISGNKFFRTNRSPISVQVVRSTNPNFTGSTNAFDINITNNTILDSFEQGTNFNIMVYWGITVAEEGGGPVYPVPPLATSGRYKASLAQQPGVSAPPYPYNYVNDFYNGNQVRSGMFGINILGNIISRTLPNVAKYSDWGYVDQYNPLGRKFDRESVTPGYWSDPAITDASFTTHGIIASSPVNGLNISNNFIQGTNFTGILLSNDKSTNILDYTNCLISNNEIIDVKGIGVFINATGSGVGASQIAIVNNTFDIDPYFRTTGHNADNTWASTTSNYAINTSGCIGLYVSGNIFKNCATTGIFENNIQSAGGNFIYADFTSGGINDIGTNLGVRYIPGIKNNTVIPIFGDPTAANYGQIRNTILKQSYSIPTTGYYIVGSFVEYPLATIYGTAGSRYTITGWWRATTGNTHVLNTDWIEVRALTGT